MLIVAVTCAALSAALLLGWSVCALRPLGTPADDEGRDRMPRWWRMSAPLTRPIADRLRPLLGPRVRARARERLRLAGLEFSLDPALLIAGQVVAALALVALVALAWSPRGAPPAWLVFAAAVLGGALPATWLRERARARLRAVLRELPFYLDVVTLAVEAGLNLSGALAHAVDKGPRGPLRSEFERFLRDLRAGRERREALRDLAVRVATPAVRNLVAALLMAERQGMALGPVLRAQAEQRRNERFQRAERLAMEAPVKMLAPLVLFIFPCTFVVLMFPLASRLIEEGWLR